jgi:precorrin-2 dehydrogenase / sirohydrochlorin ferrochelatase
MEYYPIYLNIKKRKCVVVGGGKVGERKVLTLLECGTKVTVISPEITPKLTELAENGCIGWIRRPYKASDIEDAFIIFCATDDESLNREIHRDAGKLSRLCNIADQPEACDFIVPSIIHRGDLVLTISTSGKSPAYAKKLKQSLEAQFGQEHADFLRLMGAIREKILSENRTSKNNKALFEQLTDAGIIDLIRKNDYRGINSALLKILGRGYDFKALMNTGDD